MFRARARSYATIRGPLRRVNRRVNNMFACDLALVIIGLAGRVTRVILCPNRGSEERVSPS